MTEATPGRGHNGKFLRTVDTAERDAQACRLRSRGQSLQQIADRLGYADRSSAHKAVQRALSETVRADAALYVQLQLDQLDELTGVALAVMEREHVVVQLGKVVRDDDGRPVVDHMPTLAAVDRLLRIAERRAKLLGLDAPTRHAVAATSATDVDVAMAELVEELERAAQAEAERRFRELKAGE